MGALIQDSEIAYLQSLYPMLKLKPLTSQQEQLILLYMRGQAIKAAAQGAGYKSVSSAQNFLRSENAVAIMEHLRKREFDDVRITLDSITSMFLEAYHRAGTATEMVMATRELAKLHGLYPDSKKAAVEINIGNVESIKQLERLPDAKLLELAGPAFDGVLIEGQAEQPDSGD